MHNNLFTYLVQGSRSGIMSYCRWFYLVLLVTSKSNCKSIGSIAIAVCIPERKHSNASDSYYHKLRLYLVMHYVLREFVYLIKEQKNSAVKHALKTKWKAWQICVVHSFRNQFKSFFWRRQRFVHKYSRRKSTRIFAFVLSFTNLHKCTWT